MILSDDDIETIKNALKIAASECEKVAADLELVTEFPHAESKAFRDSAMSYNKLADKIEDTENLRYRKP